MTRLRALKAIVLAVAAGFLSGCFFKNTLFVTNNSDEDLSNVKVWASGTVIWEGNIQAGETISAPFNPRRDGSLKLSGDTEDGRFESTQLGYTTPNAGAKHSITYLGEGEVTYDIEIHR